MSEQCFSLSIRIKKDGMLIICPHARMSRWRIKTRMLWSASISADVFQYVIKLGFHLPKRLNWRMRCSTAPL